MQAGPAGAALMEQLQLEASGEGSKGAMVKHRAELSYRGSEPVPAPGRASWSFGDGGAGTRPAQEPG